VIEVRGCSKTYPGHGRPGTVALDGVSLSVQEHEFVCVLGPSGCGKTTLLKIIAGLLPWDEGEVLVGGRPVRGPGPERSMVFQDFSLLPWYNVISNIAFGLELRGVLKEQREKVAREWVHILGLAGFEHHFPRQLSGGMQQRVGLARALAVEPAILLMDEPFGSVDAQTRRTLQEELLRLHDARPKTVLFVTHNMSEAVRLGDRVVVLSARPAHVEEVLDVPLPRPRASEVEKLPLFAELKEYLWERVRGEQTSLGAAPGGADV
jgi:NitT/TauT family transport system ATP-binding protein